MTCNSAHSRKVALKAGFRVFRFVVLCLLLFPVLLLCPGCRKPPDLSACTRIEVHYKIGALDYFIPDTGGQNRLLSEEERRSVKSFDTWTVTDQQLIRAFAYDVSQGTYSGKLRGGAIFPSGVDIFCWRGEKRLASFTVYTMGIVTADKNKFRYSPGMPDLAILAPPAVKPLEARWNCAWNMSKLLFEGLEYRPGRLYPDPNRWCDEIVEFLRSRKAYYTYLKDTPQYLRSDASIARMFACPSIHVSTLASDAHANLAKQMVLIWRSDYAMNPHCGKESPGDTVFLFESNPGWNQHGGPELFTFDNHDPKGGCVLLNDGKVKFIRTKEELQQLRWK
ncbi:MAG: hypothetical protein ACYST5_16090 [Planctomycetota bacterium]